MDPDVSIPPSAPPLAVDIDGTLTGPDRRLDPRVIPVLQAWPAPVVVATGKAFPYPVGLCEFLGLEPLVIAENGGVVLPGRNGPVRVLGDPAAAKKAVAAVADRGEDPGWGGADLVNRWRETERAVSRDVPRAVVDAVAAEFGLAVVDSGFAYHLTSPNVDKGRGLRILTRSLGRDPGTFVAIGDSENDAPLFDVVDRAVAVANADERATNRADHVTAERYGDGFLAGIRWLVETTDAGGGTA